MSANAAQVRVEQSEFIPFACHFDGETLLTKNGELTQTFKIEGFQFDTLQEGKKVDLRQALRDAYFAVGLHPHFCATVHIVRRRKDLNPTPMVEGFFAKTCEEEWKKKHSLANSYSNDLYFTLTHEGSNFALTNVGQFVRSLFFTPEKMGQRRALEKNRSALSAAVDAMLQALSHFKPQKLKVVEEEGVYYSEPLSLLHHVLNLEHGKRMPMPVSAISDYLVSYPVEIDFNSLTVEQPGGKVRHAALYSIKQYMELSAAAQDVFLQFPGEFVITQQILLGANPAFVKALEYKKYIGTLGEDNDYLRFSGIADLLSGNQGKWSDYALQQNAILLIANSEADLEKQAASFTGALEQVGVVAVREDVMLEEMYYAQLPASALFCRRLQPLNTKRVAGYGTLYDFPTGKLSGNLWGPAISVFHSQRGNPFFFSFHQKDNGHTLIAGPYGCAKTRLLNFLMAQSERIAPRVFWFDTHRSGEMLIRALGGSYLQIVRNREALRRPMNPLKLPDTPENRAFLARWLKLLLLDIEGAIIEDLRIDFVLLVEHIYTLAPDRRQLSKIPALAEKLPESVRAHLDQWIGTGRYGHIFDNAADDTLNGARIHGFDITEMVQDRRPQWAILSYLLHVATSALDGAPTIFVFDEAWTLFDNSIFGNEVAGLLETLRARNAIAIFATENMDGIPLSPLTERILPQFMTRILFADNEVTESFQTLMGLGAEQFQSYLSLRKHQPYVFIQQGEEHLIANAELPTNHLLADIVGGLPKHVTRMENVIAKTGEKPEDWLPAFAAHT